MGEIDLKELFLGALPAERIVADKEKVALLAQDTTEIPAGRPEIVLKLTSFEEAKAVVALARKHRIPLVPRVAGTNLGGLSLAPHGGAILDLTGMNRILEINRPDMIAVIEPGVTFQQLVDELKVSAPELTIGIPLSPPETSIMANCLLDGLGNLSLLHGTMGEWITGLEVILGTGNVIKTGAWAISSIPFSRAPLPDLTGLFVSWQGTTGLVTKMAVELKPRLPHRKRLFVLTYERKTTLELMRRFSRMRLFDDIGGLSWPTGKMLYGVPRPRSKDPGEPEFFTYIDVSANHPDELALKLRLLREVIEKLCHEDGVEVEEPFDIETLCKVSPEFEKFAEFPTDLEFLTKNPGGGLTWVGTYGPMSCFDRAVDLGIEIMERYGLPPVIVSRPMKGAHFGVLRFITTFNKRDEAEVQVVRKCNRELLDMVREQGFIAYKTPIWAVERLLPHMCQETHGLMRSIKSLLDPLGIMNPGHWQLEGDGSK